jgi:hypothetical protein
MKIQKIDIKNFLALEQVTNNFQTLIDKADILDPVNRAQLIDFLLAVRLDFESILVLATSDHADFSPVPETQDRWLEEGRITPAMVKEAA